MATEGYYPDMVAFDEPYETDLTGFVAWFILISLIGYFIICYKETVEWKVNRDGKTFLKQLNLKTEELIPPQLYINY